MGSWSAFVDACGHHGADPPPPSHHGRFPHFSQCHRSFCIAQLLQQRGKTDGGTNDRVIDPFAPFEVLAIVHNEDDRSPCSIGVLVSFDDGAAQTLFLAPSRHLQGPP